MLPTTPLSLLCAILLCLPLAAIFTIITPSTTTTGGGSAATSLPLPIGISFPTTKHQEPELLLPTRQTIIRPLPTPANQLAKDDDVSLLKLAFRVDPSPEPGKKLAFMFLTASPLPLAPLWELYFSRAPKNLYNIYVHADPSANYTTPFRGVFAGRVIPSKPTRRHTPTLISAARRLLAQALLHDASNSMFALLSPSCIPIRSFNFTYRVLRESKRSFVEILENEPGAYDRWAASGEDAMAPEVEFEDFRTGSQFWVVNRRDARNIVGDTRLWSKFKLPCLDDATCYPEEHYFPTLLSMVDPQCCVPCTLTHVDWSGGHGGHPRMYNSSEVDRDLIMGLRKSRPRYGDEESDGSNSSVRVQRRHHPFLFSRKFAPDTLHRLLSLANFIIKD